MCSLFLSLCVIKSDGLYKIFIFWDCNYFDNVTFQNLYRKVHKGAQRGTKESKMLKTKVSFVYLVPFVV